MYTQSMFCAKYENNKNNSIKNCNFYSREISLYIPWECLRNVGSPESKFIPILIGCTNVLIKQQNILHNLLYIE